MATVFTYGSLMCEDIMAAVTGSNLDFESARLSGFARYAVRGEAYPAMVRESSATVTGRIYYDVNESGLARLDVFEGDWYFRDSVVVNTAQGRLVEAQSYIFRPEYAHFIADWPWSFEYFLERGRRSFTEQYLGYQRLPK